MENNEPETMRENEISAGRAKLTRRPAATDTMEIDKIKKVQHLLLHFVSFHLPFSIATSRAVLNAKQEKGKQYMICPMSMRTVSSRFRRTDPIITKRQKIISITKKSIEYWEMFYAGVDEWWVASLALRWTITISVCRTEQFVSIAFARRFGRRQLM